MRRRSLKIIKGENGASAVEFAIILPLLVVLIFGIVEFGIAYNNYLAITHAAREGARVAAVDLTNPDLENIIRERAYPVTPDVISVSTPEGVKIGDPVVVEITYTIHIEIPFVGSWDIPLTSRATMRLENYVQP
ncbi:MAG: pilus assembly protein [Actinobacteria bacterium]|nr:pilus assembly protein [Actinomycetota bacterium]